MTLYLLCCNCIPGYSGRLNFGKRTPSQFGQLSNIQTGNWSQHIVCLKCALCICLNAGVRLSTCPSTLARPAFFLLFPEIATNTMPDFSSTGVVLVASRQDCQP